MQQEAIEVAREAMEKHTIEKDIAAHIKKEVRILPGLGVADETDTPVLTRPTVRLS